MGARKPFTLSIRVADTPTRKYGRVNSSVEAVERIRQTIALSDREVMIVLHLNPKNDIFDTELHSIGTVDSSAVYPREVMKSALVKGSSAIILAHNHPSGDTEPSLCDREVTRDVVRAGCLLQVKVLDHIIVGTDSHYSFADQGLMDDYEAMATGDRI